MAVIMPHLNKYGFCTLSYLSHKCARNISFYKLVLRKGQKFRVTPHDVLASSMKFDEAKPNASEGNTVGLCTQVKVTRLTCARK
ncbi:hypothetical protein L596_000044 [Steinernema carpocapsae]|uniref:Uncharacterized protein n=1 Tax=Steinernema carpocapsae TaxID=34508 RepID=A0A4U8UJE7_STECR|nr:hypothetical protein L596_000044 [Steinernema carpocapsae]